MMDQMKTSTETELTPLPRNKREDDLREKAELFDVDGGSLDLEKEFTYEVHIPKETKDNILRISRSIRIAVLTISGYEEQPTSDGKQTTYKLVKQPLASSEVIKVFESILKPYADESNIISKKSWDSFKIQAEADWGAFYKFCLRNKAQPDVSLRAVYRVFQGCLINIGEIVCDNPQNMERIFTATETDRYGDEEKNPFK